MGGVEGLLEGEGRLGGAVDLEGGGAAGGDDCVGGWGEGEYLGWVGWGSVVSWDLSMCGRRVGRGMEGLEAIAAAYLGPPCGWLDIV